MTIALFLKAGTEKFYFGIIAPLLFPQVSFILLVAYVFTLINLDIFQEVACCQFTFCPFDVWSPNRENEKAEKHLAYVSIDEDDASSVVLEVIRSSDGLIICSVDASQISRFGMCMALSGIPSDGICRFLAGFEAGCVVLFVEGRLVTRVSPLSPSDTRPITCLSSFTIDATVTLVALGKAAAPNYEDQLPDFELLKLTSKGEEPKF